MKDKTENKRSVSELLQKMINIERTKNKYSEIVSELEKFTRAKRKSPKTFAGIVRKTDAENDTIIIETESGTKDLPTGSAILIRENNGRGEEMKAVVTHSQDYFLEIEVENPSQFEDKKILIDKSEINVIIERLEKITEAIKKNRLNERNRKILDFLMNEGRPGYQEQKVEFLSKTLNENQKKAVVNSVRADDFHLIIGPPGTGKTFVIEELINQFLKEKKKILVTSWTNRSVDNVIKRIPEKENMEILRIGPVESMDAEVKKYSVPEKIKEREEKNMEKIKSSDKIFYEEIKSRKKDHRLNKKLISEIVDRSEVVVSTVVSSCHNFLDDVKFDVVIMDEAGQVSSFMSLLPLLKSDKFILVGDDRQLQPIGEENVSEEMNLSIFNRLLETYPSSSNLLTIQHRMHEKIADISSEIFYDGKLETSDEAAGRTLSVSPEKNRFLGPENPVMFVDTAKVKYYEDGTGAGCSNYREAEYVSDIAALFVNCGTEADDIGIITPYVKQKNLIKNFLKKNEIKNVEVDTVHKFQGREKDVILISFAKSKKNPSMEYDLKFIGQESLINVSISRARKKLILIGNSETLCQSELFRKIINKIGREGRITLGER